MQHVEWDPTLETGDSVVDEQHKALVDLFNELLAAESTEDSVLVMRALETLTAYVAVHFACEEELMAEFGYPAEHRDTHVSEHRALTDRTREIVLGYRAGEVTNIGPIVEFLAGWLNQHVNGSDRELVTWVTRARQEQVAVL